MSLRQKSAARAQPRFQLSILNILACMPLPPRSSPSRVTWRGDATSCHVYSQTDPQARGRQSKPPQSPLPRRGWLTCNAFSTVSVGASGARVGRATGGGGGGRACVRAATSTSWRSWASEARASASSEASTSS